MRRGPSATKWGERELPQALFGPDLSTESEQFGGPGRIGDDMANVAAAVLAGDDRSGSAARLAQCRRHLDDRDWPPRTHVGSQESPRIGTHSGNIGGRNIVDVDEVTHLPTILENPRRLAIFK